MPAKNGFVDSNVILYAYSKDVRKKIIAKSLLKQYPAISTQVINEVINVGTRKLKLSPDEIRALFELLKRSCDVKMIDCSTIDLALKTRKRYGYSYFDSLIIASALEHRYSILYSEDLQDGQVIEGTVTIRNPFKI